MIPLAPKRSADSTALRIARRKATRLDQLHRDRFRYELRVDLRLVDLENVDKDFAIRAPPDIVLEPVDLYALAADDDPGTRGQDVDLQLVGRALDVHGGHPGVTQTALEDLPQLEVLVQQFGRTSSRRTSANATSC